MTATTYEIAGSLRLALFGADERTARFVRAQLEPYAPLPADGGPVDVAIEATPNVAADRLLDIQRSAGDGLVTAYDGSHVYVLHGGRSCAVPVVPADGTATFAYEPGFPLRRIFGRLVRPALQLSLLAKQAAAVHAASVVVDGGAVLFAGWAESGKTETALAFAELGAEFLSDKWTVVGADGTAAAFPIRVGVRRWTLAYLPRLRAALPRRARAQLAVGRVGAAAAGPIRRVPALAQAFELAGRVALAPAEIRAAYGHTGGGWSAPLRALVLLTTVPGSEVAAGPADAEWAARRLARTAAFERRRLSELYARLRYARAADEPDPVEDAARREVALLRDVLATVPVLELRAPFPCDPRRVADAIARCL